uniref:Uncharacterized protein n=1 Tax=Oryza sativa subsp. japonica TaxID=39947 RepID=Q5Z9Z7_ORYSJ|nr:hypothetical protein [Oryza sativa Japonica Group]
MGTESGARVAGEIGEKSFEPVLWGREHGGAAREDGGLAREESGDAREDGEEQRSHGIPELMWRLGNSVMKHCIVNGLMHSLAYYRLIEVLSTEL